MEQSLYLAHHGIKGMRWGVRRYQNPDGSLTPEGRLRYKQNEDGSYTKLSRTERQSAQQKYKDRFKVEQEKIVNEDGSVTFPQGYKFNRVGGANLDFGEAGGMYVSDASSYDVHMYVQQLGPTTLARVLNMDEAHYVKQIEATKQINMPSVEKTTEMTLDCMSKNKDVYDAWKNSIYSWGIDDRDIPPFDKMSEVDPKSDLGKEISLGLAFGFGNSQFSDVTKVVYQHYRDNGYDAIPDIYDMNNTAGWGVDTPAIILNKDCVRQTRREYLTKDAMREGARIYQQLRKERANNASGRD